jgi:hypothetical protein
MSSVQNSIVNRQARAFWTKYNLDIISPAHYRYNLDINYRVPENAYILSGDSLEEVENVMLMLEPAAAALLDTLAEMTVNEACDFLDGIGLLSEASGDLPYPIRRVIDAARKRLDLNVKDEQVTEFFNTELLPIHWLGTESNLHSLFHCLAEHKFVQADNIKDLLQHHFVAKVEEHLGGKPKDVHFDGDTAHKENRPQGYIMWLGSSKRLFAYLVNELQRLKLLKEETRWRDASLHFCWADGSKMSSKILAVESAAYYTKNKNRKPRGAKRLDSILEMLK